ncbi:MAG: DUF305 domain-containing protein [Gemmatimonadota bacterium]|nr:DUF305 domain-containing protein [Gemmatimonadota bacterium]
MQGTVRAAFLATALIAFAPHAARAQDPMAGMHNMPGHIMIPKGATYTVADVEFMQGMIAHHAQAIYMSKMAEAHGANPKLLKFTQKVDQGQTAEIGLMQEWLRWNGQFAPDTSSWRTHMMPGMLTADQLKTLEASRGTAFDRNFLEMMVQHHEGALKMVEDLFATPRAGQDVDVSVFANDVVTVQTAEIGLMRRMLSELPGA